MAKLLKLRRGSTTQHASFTGAEGEVTIDTTKDTAVVHDGAQAGGRPLAREDMSNVSSASIAGQLGTDSIATTKIAGGALPTDVTVTNANVVSNAAIAGTKISPDFGSQNITTTGTGTIGSDLTVSGGDVTINGTIPALHFNDTDHESDYQIRNYNGTFQFLDVDQSGGTVFYQRETNGDTTVTGNLNVTNGADVVGNITVTGTVDGRDVAADGSKLDGIESGATADQTAAEIRTLVESASDSNVFTDADHTKLNGIEASATADQTAAEIRTLVESASDSNVFTDADHTKLNGIETGATADQTASEIVSLVNGQTITPAHVHVGTGRIGNDSNDYIAFANNSHMDVVVNGSTEFRFEADGDFHADGDVIALSTTISSDRKLKENIEVIPNALDKVQALNGVSFDWKKTGEKSAGVIAQEVQEVLPEAVKEVTPVGGGDSHLSVNYHALTSILIESIKELKAEIEELKGGK